MKKSSMKKMTAAVSAIALTAMAAAPLFNSFAAATPVITINGNDNVTVDKKSFAAYKIASVAKDDDSGAYTYTFLTAWKPLFAQKSGISETDEEFDAKVSEWIDTNYVTDATAAKKAEFAKMLAKFADEKNILPTQEVTGSGDTAVFTAEGDETKDEDNIESGYYLVVDNSDGDSDAISAFILDTYVDEALTIDLKADKPSIEKKIWEDANNNTEIDNGELKDANTAGYGEEVNYLITADIPDMTEYQHYKFIIEDTASAGLTYSGGLIVKVKGVDVTDDFVAPANGTKGPSLSLDFDDLKALLASGDITENADYDAADNTITVQYKVTVNEDAVVGEEGNPNDVELTYSNNPNKSGDGSSEDENDDGYNETSKTPKDRVETYLTQFKLHKQDSSGNKLTGAQFSLKGDGQTNEYVFKTVTDTAGSEHLVIDSATAKNETNYKVEVDENGDIIFYGLKAGTYTIKEEKAPDKYNKISDDIVLTIGCTVPDEVIIDSDETCVWSYALDDEYTGVTSEDAGIYTINIVNRKGSVLPSTGGAGTAAFAVCGISMMTCAAVLFVINRRKSEERD